MKRTTILASAIALALLSGCGSKDATEHYSDALNYIDAKQYSAAVIELKSAIQQMPDNADYRFALGKLYLQIGDAVSAEKELLLAKAGGIDVELVTLPLIRASFLADNYSAILSRHPDDEALPAQLQDYVQLYKALSELELGSAENSLRLFSGLADSDKADVAAFSQANLLIPGAKYQDAFDLLAVISAEHPHFEETLYLKANLLLAMEKNAEASGLLLDYIKLQPRQLKARLQAAQVLVKLEQYPAAQAQLDYILKAAPDQPFANYLAAVTALNNENFTAAKEFADKAIAKGYRTPQARILAAVASIRLGLESQALHHLTSVAPHLDAYPQLERLYIALQLKESKADDAQKTLLDMNMTDADIQLVAGTALNLVKQGNTAAARELVSKYESSMSGEAQSLSSLGQLRMAIPGEELAAIRDLERALLLDPGMHDTRLVLAANYLKNEQFDKADQLAQEWVNNPESANLGYNLKAYSALLQKDVPAAKSMLASAAESAPDNPLTLLLQATVAQVEQDYPLAIQLNNKLLQARPTYLPALRQAYALARQNKNTAAILATARETQQREPDNYPLRLTVAQLFQMEGKADQVVALLEKTPADNSQRLPAHWTMLIEANVNLNKAADALRLSKNWHEQDPAAFQAAVIYANLLLRQNKPQEALRVVQLQQSRYPDNVQLRMTQISALEALQQYSAATDALAKLPEKIRDNAYNLALKGRLLLLQKKPTPALEALLQSYDLQPANSTATVIADLYAKEYSFRRGIEFIEQHMKDHEPSDMMQSYYANLLMQSDPQKAQQIYASLTEAQANNFIFLNNYAWLLLNDNKVTEAEKYARQALALAPENPDVIDTYGTTLMRLNNTSGAIAQFEKSLSLRPGSSDVQLNYAEALLMAGKTAEANNILQQVKSDDRKVNQRLAELQAKASQ
ncbi:XrtA/PEP-CTERM system TPR-repeat protein PrsT [Rheinheimera sp. NSM]|uniref:XrtA/PEP-CTERM system TPR-repeat protein PrsT n=1 Tax=Rheinheimera sp. NSM TaxID=3457884 RepID=UPI00403663F2